MIAVFYYLLKVIICSGILYGYYHLVMRNKVFHEWNRFYLIAVIPFSILLPLLDINIMAPDDNDSKIITAMQIVAGADEYIMEVQTSSAITWSAELISSLLYAVISMALMVVFCAGIYRILKMIRKYKPVMLENFYFLNTHEPGTPFSFFKYLLWNEEISLSSEGGKRIMEHELVHIRERHSWDKIFIHLVLVFFWINPFFWLIRQEMTMIHEFIADRRSVGRGDVNAFAKLILEASFPSHSGMLTSSFFQSSIKRRLAMITKTTNPRVMYLSRLMMIPLLFLLAFTFAVKAKTIIAENETPPLKLDQKYYVVIDAGHGGDDNGAMAGSVKEKDVNLQLARMVKEMNKNTNLELILTRGDDKATGLSDRVKLAEEKNANLFLSIHVASAPSATEKGITAFISKRDLSRYDQNVRFASLLLNNLSTIYNVDKNIKQRDKTGVWVLDKNVCPAVILECGYISNTEDRNFISSRANQEKIANQILKSIEDYFAKTVLIQPAQQQVQLVGNVLNDTLPKSSTKKTAIDSNQNSNKNATVVQGYPANQNPNKNTAGTPGSSSNKNSGTNAVVAQGSTNAVVVQGYPLGQATSVNGATAQGSASRPASSVNAKVAQGSASTPASSVNATVAQVPASRHPSSDDQVNYFVDGMPVSATVANSINPDNIASVNVSKNAGVTNGNSISTVNIVTKTVNASNAKTSNLSGIKKGSPPLYILEGKEITEEEMNLIDPEKIESLSILKDKTTEKLYGEKGKNGVIVITLKKRS